MVLKPAYGLRGSGPGGLILRSDLGDPESTLASRPRLAARFDRVSQFASFSYAPSAAQALTISWRMTLLKAPVGGNTYVLGRATSGYPLIGVTAAREIKIGTTGGASISTGYYHALNHEVFYEWTFSASAETLTADGVVIYSGSAVSLSTTPNTYYIGKGQDTATEVFAGFLLRGLTFTDTSTAANSCIFELDEPTGNYRNRYSGTTAAAYATRNGLVGTARVNTAEGNGAVLPAVMPTHTRVAAFGGNAAAQLPTAGCFASFSWAPSAGTVFGLRFVGRSSRAPAGNCYILGSGAADKFDILVATNGAVSVRAGAVTKLAGVAGDIAYDGGYFDGLLVVDPTNCYLYINNQLIRSGAHGIAPSTTAGNQYIGASGTASQRWPGTIQLIEAIDYLSANNCARYEMDEVQSATSYANALATSGDPLYNASNTVGAATKNGMVLTAPVQSHDGRGRPWQVGDGGALVYEAWGNVDLTGLTTDTNIGSFFNQETEDPTGSLAAGVLTAPAAGKVRALICAGISETAGVASTSPYIGFRLNAALGDRYIRFRAPASTSHQNVTFVCEIDVSAGDTVQPRLGGITASSTLAVEDRTRLRYEFTPTPTAG